MAWGRFRVELQLDNIQLGPGLTFGSDSLGEWWCPYPWRKQRLQHSVWSGTWPFNEMSNRMNSTYFIMWSNSSQMLWIWDWDGKTQVLLLLASLQKIWSFHCVLGIDQMRCLGPRQILWFTIDLYKLNLVVSWIVLRMILHVSFYFLRLIRLQDQSTKILWRAYVSAHTLHCLSSMTQLSPL